MSNYDDRESSGSGMGVGDDTYSDDEDYPRQRVITLDVKCEWAHANRESPGVSVHYILLVYTTHVNYYNTGMY